jgi:pimeloyl-ACP methyl ester carboxylesterase
VPNGRRLGAALGSIVLAAAACSGPSSASAPSASAISDGQRGLVDVGGYELDWWCQGSGSPTVVLEAGYDSGGTSTFFGFLPRVAEMTRVCTYDRAGTGTSDPRPSSMAPVTGERIASELHAVLGAIPAEPPLVLVGHSYGGLLVRVYAAAHPDDVAGLVLIDASSEPEIPIYRELHAGAWIDGGMKVGIDEVIRELAAAPPLGAEPLVVLTAGIIEDEWLKTVPAEERAAQDRLAGLSSNSVHALAPDTGHFIQSERPALVLEAVREVVEAVRTGEPLPPCGAAMTDVGARCL